MDTLIKAIEAKGWTVGVNPKDWRALRAKVGVEEVGVLLEELIESRPHVPTEDERKRLKADHWFYTIPKRERFATGRLYLGVHAAWTWGRTHWSDTTRWRVEECLDLCLDTIARTVEGRARDLGTTGSAADCGREAERQRQEAEQRRKEEEFRQAQLRARRGGPRSLFLTEHIEQMRLANLVQEYADRLEAAAKPAGMDPLKPRRGAVAGMGTTVRGEAGPLQAGNCHGDLATRGTSRRW